MKRSHKRVLDALTGDNYLSPDKHSCSQTWSVQCYTGRGFTGVETILSVRNQTVREMIALGEIGAPGGIVKDQKTGRWVKAWVDPMEDR